MKRILILEDEKFLQQVIATHLEEVGYEAVLARSVQEAQKHIEFGDGIVAVWLDHMVLGDGNGVRFMGWLRGQIPWRHLPVFVVSGSLSPEVEAIYRRYGVVECYSKISWSIEHITADILEQLHLLEVTAAAR